MEQTLMFVIVLYLRYKILELLCYITMGVVPALVLLSMVS